MNNARTPLFRLVATTRCSTSCRTDPQQIDIVEYACRFVVSLSYSLVHSMLCTTSPQQMELEPDRTGRQTRDQLHTQRSGSVRRPDDARLHSVRDVILCALRRRAVRAEEQTGG